MTRGLGVLLGLALAGALWLGLSRALSPPPTLPPPAAASSATPAPAATRRPPRLRCRAGVPRCASVRGEVLLVESVDPDGDGDLHVVLAGGSVTGPGLTAVDVRPGLRPERDPRTGDFASAMGPVQRGSFGQEQVHALAVRFAR